MIAKQSMNTFFMSYSIIWYTLDIIDTCESLTFEENVFKVFFRKKYQKHPTFPPLYLKSDTDDPPFSL